MFGSADRNLLPEYDLEQYFKDEIPRKGILRLEVPVALSNLADAANLDLEELHLAQKNDDRGCVHTLLSNAGTHISQLLRDSWTQSDLSLSLDLDGWRLQILLKSESGDFVKVVERSDGLRQYLALLLFLMRQPIGETKPIILIDEAETHLHYDAQADLMQTLASQALAEKVVYTTHSIGCLPEDLGSGVRMVSVEEPYSRIDNWFWNSSRPGFSPLLFAMGASTLAFIPMRYAVVAEGAADMILVPSLLKDGLRKNFLGFQVVPGLSSGTEQEIAIVDNEAARTAYLGDGDSAGRKMMAKVRAAGVDESKIVTLPSIGGDETVIEDYVETSAYLKAVNIELKRSGSQQEVLAGDLPRPNRPKRLEEWCAANDLSVPSKRAVAYHIVELKHECPIVDPDAVPNIIELNNLISKALGL